MWPCGFLSVMSNVVSHYVVCDSCSITKQPDTCCTSYTFSIVQSGELILISVHEKAHKFPPEIKSNSQIMKASEWCDTRPWPWGGTLFFVPKRKAAAPTSYRRRRRLWFMQAGAAPSMHVVMFFRTAEGEGRKVMNVLYREPLTFPGWVNMGWKSCIFLWKQVDYAISHNLGRVFRGYL